MKKTIIAIVQIVIIVTSTWARDWYVRPSGGNYGLENGTSYANAWDGLLNVKWGTGGVQPGDTLWVCGLQIHDMVVKAGATIPVISGTGESTRVTIRGDYPGDPGIIWGCYKPSYESWVNEGNNVWSITIPGDLPDCGDYFFFDITPTSWTVSKPVASLQACQNTSGSHYSPNYRRDSKIYVHCPDNGNPTGRFYMPWYGYNFANRGGKSYITYLNLKLYDTAASIWNPNDATHIRWQGCTVRYNSGGTAPFCFYDGCHYMEVLGCDIGYVGNGIYIISNSNNAASYCRFAGNTFHDIGVLSTDQNGDAHGIGIQGGYNNIIEDNYFYNCGVTICLFAFPNQELKNTIIRRNFIKDSHQLGPNDGYGISLQCENNSLSDKSGNQIYQNIVVNCTVGIRVQYEDQVEVYNNVVVNCEDSFVSHRSYNNYGPSVRARNNISLNPRSYHVWFATNGANSMCDYNYNLYYPDGGSKFYHSGESLNFSGWKARGFDLNSKVADPLFQSPANENFQLQSSSPAIDAGINVGLTQDRLGTPIPQGFAPDIGAYECKKTIFTRISVSPTSGAPPLAVSFSGDARGDNPPFSYRWDFGDGQFSDLQSCSHTYTKPGAYTGTLTVTDSRANNEIQSVIIQAYKTYRLSLATSTGAPTPGSGGTTSPPPGNYLYPEATFVPLSAIAYLNYRFSQWTGDLASSETFRQQTPILIDGNKSVIANFCTKCGDVNGDLTITPSDAQAAFDIFLGKMPNPTACQKENADVNADGTKTSPRITPMDAQLIFDKYLARNELPSDCSGNSRATSAFFLRREGSASFGHVIYKLEKNSVGDIFFSVAVVGKTNLAAFGFDLRFPRHNVKPIGLEKAELPEGFNHIDYHEVASGLLRVGGYLGKQTHGSPSAVWLTLVFRVMKVPVKAEEFRIVGVYDGVSIDSIRIESAPREEKTQKKQPKKVAMQWRKQQGLF